MKASTILIIEDDPAVAQSLQDGLSRAGFEVIWKASGGEGMQVARQSPVNLILLDVRLPDGSGFDFCRQMRQKGLHAPIIMLTAQNEALDKVLGLEMGADDYVTKPFDLRELISRIRAELAYRGLNAFSPTEVLADSFHTACLIGMRGYSSEKEYTELLSGIKKLAGFVYAEHFTLDSAILCAAKVAYIAALIGKGDQNISRFDSMIDLSSLAIQNPAYSRLNKVKKTSPEAFYYFYRAIEG